MGVSVKAGGGVNSEPNVVPMIDVMLVLLVIFMVVTPALASGFAAEPPSGVNLKAHPEEEFDQILGIDKYGQYYLNKKKIDNATLGDSLTNIYSGREDAILYLKAHRELPYEIVQQAWNVASRSGVRVVAAITDQASGASAEAEKE
ncbi:MAG: ExbD/TolR family protein [Gemmatimonadaceae bacterium]|jgi:biopolymer transport protein ExbD